MKKIVVKVGTSTLTYSDGKLNIKKIKKIVKEISKLIELGYKVILVTSGAVGAGMGKLNLSVKPTELVQKRALASIGQVELIHLYQSLFFAFDVTIAQLLLTKDDFADRQRYINARNMVNRLLDMGIVPIVNENDSVVVNEIKVGDNDSLSAFVSSLVDADKLIVLSDIDGLYDSDPNKNKDAKLIKEVTKLTEEIYNFAGVTSTNLGTGGMKTKLIAANMCMENGIDMVICNGENPENITKIALGEKIGTIFYGNEVGIKSKKYWLKYATNKYGNIIIDKGARDALLSGKSLLSVGVKDVEGHFNRGSVVRIKFENQTIAFGMINYSSNEVEQIKGLHSDEIVDKLGYKNEDVLVHIDNMVVEG